MIQFKTARLEGEYQSLLATNKRLYALLILMQEYSKLNFGKDIVVTCLYRSEAENKALYSPNPEPAWKPHTLWLAADLRSSIFTDAEIKKLLVFLNTITVFSGQRNCGVYHQIAGNVFHFHIQIDRGA